MFDVAIALVAIDAELKPIGRDKFHELGENRLTGVQALPPK
jgi:hypothetical protein